MQKTWVMGLSAVVVGVMAATSALASHDAASQNLELRIPGIWVDPDGCQHWVMDDGLEGYMTPNVMPNGRPVCGSQKTCGVVNTDHLYRTDQFALTSKAKKVFLDFFKRSGATVFRVSGHTDSRASHPYNDQLSLNRASAVANLARGAGYQVTDVTGFGERKPIDTNKSVSGRAHNRRVEIECVK